jgi:hypothetical protein
MFTTLSATKLKGRGTVLYCKDDEFDQMTQDEVKNFTSKIKKIKILDKNSQEIELIVKEFDVMNSISDKLAVALLVEGMLEEGDLTMPSPVTVS